MQATRGADGGGLETALAEHARRFLALFPGAPPRRFFSPGRVNLMGAHLDYNGGPVMPMALDRGTFVALRARDDRRVVLASTLEEERLEFALDAPPARASGRWFDYPLGVLLHLLRTRPGARGAEVLFGGNLPIGAGLSSSASICVGTAFAFRACWGEAADPLACIEAALWGERSWVGVQCGIMDPYAVALSRPGHILWLECRSARYHHLPFDSDGMAIAVVDSGIRRELAKGDFNHRVSECQEAFRLLAPHAGAAQVLAEVAPEVVERHAHELAPPLLARARHVVGEVARTQAARTALEHGEAEAFGRCVSATHASLRDLFEVSVPELDLVVERALGWPGVLGARLTGAGFGGCVVVVLRPAACAGFRAHLEPAFEARFGRRPPVFFFRGDAGPREVSGAGS